jgi:methionyl-tRNA synthetase
MNKKIFIAVAWPYVNGDLHVGHLAGYLIPADIEARFQRFVGSDVLMVSGSDCHGTPITVEADKKGKTPQEIVKHYHKRDVELFEKYRLSYNLYTKTTSEVHKKVVQELFLDLLNNGFIIKKSEEQYYSPDDKKFLPDRYVEGECPHCHAKEQRSDQCESCGRMLDPGTLINPYSKLTKSAVTLKETEHYYLDLSKLSEDLDKYVDSKKDIWRSWIYHEAKGWIKEGLRARAITRDLDWGIELPVEKIPDDLRLESFEGKRLYVWFEAVTGYLSAPQEFVARVKGEFDDGEEVILNQFKGQSLDWKEWIINEDSFHYYFLGQDNVVFHTILWPGQLMGAKKNYHLPDNVAANKFMNFQGKKFSKSRNWIVDSSEIAEEFGVDAVRYYITANLPENKSGNFTWESFVDANNNELVANLGNFVNRTLVFINKNFAGEINGDEEMLVKEVQKQIEQTFSKTKEFIQSAKFVEGLNTIMELASFGNKYFNDSEVWKIVKEETGNEKQETRKILFNLLQIVSALSVLIEPYLPDASARLRDLLNQEALESEVGKDQWQFKVIKDFNLADRIEPLFTKLDREEVLESKK